VCLPIPIKINDQTTVLWEQASLTSIAMSAVEKGLDKIPSTSGSALSEIIGGGLGAAGTYLSYAQGIAINPNLVMLFKTQNFKQHTLQWLLAPNTRQDTENLNNIIKLFKTAMLPSKGGSFSGSLASIPNAIVGGINSAIQQFSDGSFSATLQYPWIVLPQLSVAKYTYKFKPCAIEAFSVDFSPGPSPAFFGQTQAPGLVSITMQLKEIELWFQGDDL
jgi:hypothetical protein